MLKNDAWHVWENVLLRKCHGALNKFLLCTMNMKAHSGT